MSKLLAVAARELRERWLLFPGALVAGLFPLVIPAFGVSRDVAPTAGAVGAALLGVAAAVVIGSSMLARDSSNGRLGFLFSRPLPWGDHLGRQVAGRPHPRGVERRPGRDPLDAGLPAGVARRPPRRLLAASVVGIRGDAALRGGPAARDRPRQLQRHGVPLPVGLAGRRSRPGPPRGVDRTAHRGAPRVARHRGNRPALPVGPARSARDPRDRPSSSRARSRSARGRTDLRRAHVAMSVTLLGDRLRRARARRRTAGVGPGGAPRRPRGAGRDERRDRPLGSWVWRLAARRFARTPDRFGVRAFRSPGPARRLVAGPRGPRFLERRRFRRAISWPRPTAGRARWCGSTSPALLPARSRSSSSRARRRGWRSAFDLSPSGSLALLAHETGASLYAVPSGRRVATATLPPGWRAAATCFLAEDRVRAWLVPSLDGERRGPRAPVVRAWCSISPPAATRGRHASELAPAPGVGGWPVVLPDARGGRLLTDHGGLQLRDGATGSLIATLVEGPGRRSAALHEGRPHRRRGAARMGSVRLRVFDPNGAAAAETHLDLPVAAPAPAAGPGGDARAGGGRRRALLLRWRDARRGPRDARGRGATRGPRAGALGDGKRRRPRCARRVPCTSSWGGASWCASTSRPASAKSWPARGAGGRAAQRALSDWIITSRARPEASTSRRTRGSVSSRNAASSAARSRAASPATRIGGRRPPRTMRCEAARRETRPLPSSNGAISTIRARATAAPCSGFRSREPAPSSHSSSVARRLGDELRRRGGRAVPLPLSAAEAHRPRERLVPRSDRREAERRTGRHRGAGAAQREDFRRAFARDARGAHLVPGRADSRELEAAEQLRVLDDPRQLRVVRSKATLLEQRREALLLHGRARLQAEGLAHAVADSRSCGQGGQVLNRALPDRARFKT